MLETGVVCKQITSFNCINLVAFVKRDTDMGAYLAQMRAKSPVFIGVCGKYLNSNI